LVRQAKVPVYGRPLTLALAAERLREHGLGAEARLMPVRPRDRLEVGPFRIEPIRVTHSIADGIGLAIETPAGTIVHTGDFRLDPHPIDGQTPDYARFTELGEQGVLVLCSDSTNVDRPGHTPSESEVGPALAPRFAAATGRIILATFASHIHRIQQVLELAARVGRKAALLGMSMEKNVRIAAELGYLQIPAGVLLPLEEVAALPARRQVILSTGSQGEPNSALALLAAGEHKHVRIERGGFPTGRVLVDGTGVGDVGSVVLRDRQLLAESGMVVVSLAVDRSGAVVAGPELASRGVVYVKESEELLAEVKAAVSQALAE